MVGVSPPHSFLGAVDPEAAHNIPRTSLLLQGYQPYPLPSDPHPVRDHPDRLTPGELPRLLRNEHLELHPVDQLRLCLLSYFQSFSSLSANDINLTPGRPSLSSSLDYVSWRPCPLSRAPLPR